LLKSGESEKVKKAERKQHDFKGATSEFGITKV
jgi:hypothetical protein